jgi:hypothetical protein
MLTYQNTKERIAELGNLESGWFDGEGDHIDKDGLDCNMTILVVM